PSSPGPGPVDLGTRRAKWSRGRFESLARATVASRSRTWGRGRDLRVPNRPDWRAGSAPARPRGPRWRAGRREAIELFGCVVLDGHPPAGVGAAAPPHL